MKTEKFNQFKSAIDSKRMEFLLLETDFNKAALKFDKKKSRDC